VAGGLCERWWVQRGWAPPKAVPRGRDCTGNPRYLDEGADMAFVTRWPCRNASLARVSVNDRLRNTIRVTYFRDIGPQGVPLPSGEHLAAYALP
jgi:hypothetical protein